MEAQVLSNPRVLQATPREHGGTVDRAGRDDNSLASADDGEIPILVLDESSETVLPRRCGSVFVDLGKGSGKVGRGSSSEEKTVDGRLDEEFRASLGRIAEESDDSSLLLAARAAVATEAARVFVASRVLLADSTDDRERSMLKQARLT